MTLTQAVWLCFASLLFPGSVAIKDISSMRGVAEVTADGKAVAMTMMRKEDDNKGKSKKSFGNGLLLQETKSGDGRHFPKAGDILKVHYTLKLNGQKIDSTRDGWNDPLEVSLGSGSVVPGWDMAFPKMSLGQRGILHVPASLAYGKEGVGSVIPPNSDLEYDVELLGINQLRVHSDSEEREATGPDMRGDTRPNISLDDNSSSSTSTSKSESGSATTSTPEPLELGAESTNDSIALSVDNATADDLFTTAEDDVGNLDDAANSSDSLAVDLATSGDNATDGSNMTFVGESDSDIDSAGAASGSEGQGADNKTAEDANNTNEVLATTGINVTAADVGGESTDADEGGVHGNSSVALATTGANANASAVPLAMASQSVGNGSVGNASGDAPAAGAVGLANITKILASASSSNKSNNFNGPAALNMVNITQALEQAIALATSINSSFGGGSGGQDSEALTVSDLDKLVSDSNSSDKLLAGVNSSDKDSGFDDSLERIASSILASAAKIRSALRSHANASKASDLLNDTGTSDSEEAAAEASNKSSATAADAANDTSLSEVTTTMSPNNSGILHKS